ncbi:MAG: TetR/AcrR family transcriptional regulator [Acutalibacteraceae bacterium]
MEAKNRILSASVRMFIEHGYKETTMLDIIKTAGVSAGTFQNIFHTKDGVLMELVEVMFVNQFGIADQIVGEGADPVLRYAVETSVQLTLAELNENLRQIYVEAYTQPKVAELVSEKMAGELCGIFDTYLPGYSQSDFYEMDIGTAGIMRSYMARRCDKYFTLQKKLERFLAICLRAYKVPEDKVEQTIKYVLGLDICNIADRVMQTLFSALAMKFEFSLSTEGESRI